MQRAVFLDRDGVLIRTTVRDGTPYPPQTASEVEILPGVVGALELFKQHELLLVVITNQPDVARGTQTRAGVEGINRLLAERLPLNAIFTCYHDNSDGCVCRKPRPGMILQAADKYNIDLRQSFVIGDRWSDIAAGQAAGCTTILLDAPYSRRHQCSPDYVTADMPQAANIIIKLLHESRSLMQCVR